MEDNADDYSDVDWSDGDGGSEDERNGDVSKSEDNDGTLTLNIGATVREENDKKRKRDTVTYNDEDRSKALGCHQTDLRTAYYRALLVSKWCNDEFLSALMLSLLPLNLSVLLSKQKNTNVQDILKVANWFKKYFRKIKDASLTADEGNASSHTLFSLLS